MLLKTLHKTLQKMLQKTFPDSASYEVAMHWLDPRDGRHCETWKITTHLTHYLRSLTTHSVRRIITHFVLSKHNLHITYVRSTSLITH
jgi:hypothetical protein